MAAPGELPIPGEVAACVSFLDVAKFVAREKGAIERDHEPGCGRMSWNFRTSAGCGQSARALPSYPRAISITPFARKSSAGGCEPRTGRGFAFTMIAISGARGRRRSGDCMAATAGSDKWLRAALERCWDRRRWLMWIPLVIPLLPLALGQGWIGEVVFILLVFVGAPDGLSYFFPFIMDHTRMLVAFPFAVALLTPWPEWVIAALIVASWLLVAGVTRAVASRLFPNDATASMLAFFLAGVSAYDISLLHAGYVQLLVASLLHWTGMLALLMYCERKSMASLLGSTALQALSIAVYATAFPAIAVGPFVAFAILSSRSGYRAAIRPAAAIAIAWWALVAVYLLALAWVAKQPGAYITAGGGLTMSAPLQYLSLVVQLVASNFDPAAWLHPVPQFGDPPRLIAPLLVWVISGVAALTMIPLVIGAFRADRGAPGLADARWVLGSLLLAVVVSNMATALLQSAGMNFRTHLVSRLYAALIIAALAATGVRSGRWWIRGLAAIALLAFLSIGAWTVTDRTTYLASIWPRHRTELRSLDLAVRKIEPSAGIVLVRPVGCGLHRHCCSLARDPLAGADSRREAAARQVCSVVAGPGGRLRTAGRRSSLPRGSAARCRHSAGATRALALRHCGLPFQAGRWRLGGKIGIRGACRICTPEIDERPACGDVANIRPVASWTAGPWPKRSLPVTRKRSPIDAVRGRAPQSQTPNLVRLGVWCEGCLTMTYFRTGAPYYHRRTAVSRSCSGWEGVVPAGYGRQALSV